MRTRQGINPYRVICRYSMLLGLAGLLAGCDRRASSASVVVSKPAAPSPLAVQAATPGAAPDLTAQDQAQTAASTQPPPAMLYMSDQGTTQQLWFPPAILRLSQDGGRLSARLTTDDPPAAINDSYQGNSFDLDMPLDNPDPAAINQSQWEFQAPSADKQDDSPHGIFLSGQRRRLHAQHAVARFERQGDHAQIILQGSFYLFESTGVDRPFNPPRLVTLSGRIDAQVSESRK